MKERSSHSIFKITIESEEAGPDSDNAMQVSQLNSVILQILKEQSKQVQLEEDLKKVGILTCPSLLWV